MPINYLQINFSLEFLPYHRYTISVMIITFEASANVDTSLFGYFTMEYDPELFSDIKENLTEIKKDEPLSFKLNTDKVKLLHGNFVNIRRIINIQDIELKKFTDVFNRDFNTSTFKKFKTVKLHIDKEYFYFTGFYDTIKGTNPIEFQSLNFDTRFIETLEKQYNKAVVE
jgi:hypothetical protein